MWAKEKWLGRDVRAAREVLERAFVRNSESEQISLAAITLEAENGVLAVARKLLEHARTVADTERVITTFLLLSANTVTHLDVYLSLDLDEVGRIRTTARPV
jgi:hypothetical protein